MPWVGVGLGVVGLVVVLGMVGLLVAVMFIFGREPGPGSAAATATALAWLQATQTAQLVTAKPMTTAAATSTFSAAPKPLTPTATPLPTDTPISPTSTLLPPTPTDMPLPPTPTNTPVSPTAMPSIIGRIAFTSYRDGNNEIYVMNADGSAQTNLTNNPADDWGPSWSPQ